MLSLSLFVLAAWSAQAAAISITHGAPVVQLSYGAFQGMYTDNVMQFLGIPFAAPPCVV